MANFKMDRQTFRDLNVFTDASGDESIFSFFKATRIRRTEKSRYLHTGSSKVFLKNV